MTTGRWPLTVGYFKTNRVVETVGNWIKNLGCRNSRVIWWNIERILENRVVIYVNSKWHQARNFKLNIARDNDIDSSSLSLFSIIVSSTSYHNHYQRPSLAKTPWATPCLTMRTVEANRRSRFQGSHKPKCSRDKPCTLPNVKGTASAFGMCYWRRRVPL
jgi:hypothetical protein